MERINFAFRNLRKVKIRQNPGLMFIMNDSNTSLIIPTIQNALRYQNASKQFIKTIEECLHNARQEH